MADKYASFRELERGAPWSLRSHDIRYSVFKSAQPNSPSQACVVVNFGDAPESAEINFEGVRVVWSLRLHSTRIATPICPSASPFLLTNWQLL